MNTFADILSSPWLQALGWTLLHSLWQAILVTVVVLIAIKCIPSRLSNTRYLVATVGLALIFFLSVGTFLHLITTENTQPEETVMAYQFSLSIAGNGPQRPSMIITLLETLITLVERNIPAIVMMWSIGALLFSLRVFTGWWYVQRIRGEAVLLDDHWSKLVQQLASSIEINQYIPLAESSRIQIPIVIGYLKPMILFPVGICSGLSVEQLESIILHELVHIKRRDYLVNIVQLFLEAIYFFNPFVWMISGIIKREREHCCDDAVVQSNKNPIAYVRALASLEEARLSKSGLALSFAKDKNQLLKRIKRLMEKSVRNYSGRERIIPFVLLIIGLICASWLTIQSGRSAKDSVIEPIKATVASDTTGKRNNFSNHKKKVPQADINAKDEISADVEAENELMVDVDHDLAPIPPIADLDIAIPPIPGLTDMNLDIAIPPFQVSPDVFLSSPPQFSLDTIVLPQSWHARDWDKFSKEFEKEFAEQFGCKIPKKELQAMMEELERKFDPKFREEGNLLGMIDLARNQEQIARIQMEKIELDKELAERHGKSLRKFNEQHEESLRKFEQDVRRWNDANDVHRKEIEENVTAIEESISVLQGELQEELVNDGYLKEDEKVNSIDANDKRIKINGKDIKPSDQKKYQTLLDKFSTESAELRKNRPISTPGRME